MMPLLRWSEAYAVPPLIRDNTRQTAVTCRYEQLTVMSAKKILNAKNTTVPSLQYRSHLKRPSLPLVQRYLAVTRVVPGSPMLI